jgi:anti-sigma regulatory factor (Ser/Thr protein kinase)
VATLSIAVPYVSFDGDAVASCARTVRTRLVMFASEVGADRHQQARVALAVSEAVANVVMHAYRGRAAPQPLHVAADFEDGDLEIVVADEGEGLRPGRSPGLGAGLGIVAECCDAFVVREREGAGIELWMRFHIRA